MAVVNNINLVFGAGVIHITVVDQHGNPIPPSEITWNVANPSIVAIEPDETGFNFGINTTVADPQSTIAIATYNGPGNPNPIVGPELVVNVPGTSVNPAITALQYMSP